MIKLINNAREMPTNGRVTRICFSPARGWYVRGGKENEQTKARAWLAEHNMTDGRVAA